MTRPGPLEAVDFEGACHCGAVRFHIHLDQGLRDVRRCTCSICRMRGAVAVAVPLMQFTLKAGADRLTQYRFNTREARHYFCSVCGIYTHHQRRSNPTQYSVNVACLADISPFDFAAVPVVDGVNHPHDGPGGRAAPARRIGTLRFEPVSASEGE